MPPSVAGSSQVGSPAAIGNGEETLDACVLNAQIESLPKEGGRIRIATGIHWLLHGIQIHRSGVTIEGEPGAVLKLEAGVNEPVIQIGADEAIPTLKIHDIRVENLEIDGNREAQIRETDLLRPWIRNNGMDVRATEGLVVNRVDIHDARSGALVLSWGSSNVVVTASEFHHNHFDGIALYASEDVRVSGFRCYSNLASGVSCDNHFRNSQFTDGVIEGNGDLGIFVRHAKNLIFSNLTVRANHSHGSFLSHSTLGTGSGVYGLRFEACAWLGNRGVGIWLASPAAESPGTEVVNCRFEGNGDGDFRFAPGSILIQDGKPRGGSIEPPVPGSVQLQPQPPPPTPRPPAAPSRVK